MQKFITKKGILFSLFLLCIALIRAQDEVIQISESVRLIALTPTTYIHISSKEIKPYGMVAANGLLVRTTNGVVVIDTPWNIEQAEDLINYISNNWNEKVCAIIPTHLHNDCAGGLEVFHKVSALSYGLAMTDSILKVKPALKIALWAKINTTFFECGFFILT